MKCIVPYIFVKESYIDFGIFTFYVYPRKWNDVVQVYHVHHNRDDSKRGNSHPFILLADNLARENNASDELFSYIDR